MVLTKYVPDVEKFGRVLRDILGREVTSKSCPVSLLNAGSQGVIGVYEDETGAVCAVVYMDMMLAAATGASLSLIPAGSLKEVERTGTIPESIMENTVEIFNIGRGWFPAQETVRFSKTVTLPADVDKAVAALMKKPRRRTDARLNVKGYAEGLFAMFLK